MSDDGHPPTTPWPGIHHPLTLRESARFYDPGYEEWWTSKSDEEKRAVIQDNVNSLQADFSPTGLTLLWLLEQAGIDVP